MRVELSTAFAVLAHELRGCTSVIQGYVRLLQQTRGADSPDAALLAKLLDATGRLTTLGKQATETASWAATNPTHSHDDEDTITMAQLISDATSLHQGMRIAVSLPEPLGRTRISTSSRTALVAAVGAVIGGVSRNSTDGSISIDAASADKSATLQLRAPGISSDRPHADDAAARVAFLGQGGQNLSLILASHVLAAHGAQLTAASARPPLVRLHFATRGPQ